MSDKKQDTNSRTGEIRLTEAQRRAIREHRLPERLPLPEEQDEQPFGDDPGSATGILRVIPEEADESAPRDEDAPAG